MFGWCVTIIISQPKAFKVSRKLILYEKFTIYLKKYGLFELQIDVNRRSGREARVRSAKRARRYYNPT